MSVDADQVQQNTNPDIERLVRLQGVDSDIQAKRKLAETTLPKEIDGARGGLEAAEARLKNFDDELAAMAKTRREMEAEVESTKDSIAKGKQKLPDVKTNVEYRAVLKEIENFEKKIVQLDDKQLELMERQDEKAGERKSLEEVVAAERARFDAMKKEKEAVIDGLKKEIEALRAERKTLVNDITPSVLTTYEKVSQQREGVGIAEVDERTCQACHQLIPPQLYYHIRTTDGIYSCPHCHRYLYFVHKTDEDDKIKESEEAGGRPPAGEGQREESPDSTEQGTL